MSSDLDKIDQLVDKFSEILSCLEQDSATSDHQKSLKLQSATINWSREIREIRPTTTREIQLNDSVICTIESELRA